MIPIFEQGPVGGIGLTVSDFCSRFDAICREHIEQKRAKAFAFIFFDFGNSDLRKILKNHGAFTQLDRLSSQNLSIVYLHSARRETFDIFNSKFLSMLGVTEQAELPCVVFFKFKNDKVADVVVAELNNSDLIHGFHELHGVIGRYVDTSHDPTCTSVIRWIRGSASFVGIEAIRAALRKVMESIF